MVPPSQLLLAAKQTTLPSPLRFKKHFYLSRLKPKTMQPTKTILITMLTFIAGIFVSCNQSGTTTQETATDTTAVQPTPPAATGNIVLVVSHHVADYAKWRPFFNRDEAFRLRAKLNVMNVFQEEADPNYVSIAMKVGDMDSARQFIASDRLKNVMTEAGVTDQPEIKFYEFVFQDDNAAASSDNRVFVVARVQDYNAWKQVFDEREAMRKEKGISTVVIARNLDDPNEVAVALIAASMQTLKDHMSSQDVKDAMQRAGVISQPMIQYAKKAAEVAM